MLRRFKEWQIDLFAVPITLNREGKKKANSRHGIFLTILFAGFIIWIIYSSSRELFVRKNPNTISYDSFVETPAPMELSKDSFPFAFGLQTPILQGLTFFKDETIYIPNVKIVIFKLVKESDGSITKERVLVPVQVEACTLKHFGESWKSFTDLPLSDLYCIKPGQDVLIEGIEDFTYYQGLNVAIQTCRPASGICKTDPEIEDQLTGAWFNIFYTQSAINPQNFTHPNQRIRTIFTSMVSPATYKSAITKMNHLKVISDDGWLTENIKEQNFIKMNTPTEYLDLTPSTRGFLWNGVFEVGQVMTTYERKYTRLQTVLAEIQGSATAVILALVIMLQPYSQVKFNETLINELFDVKMKKRDGASGRKGKKGSVKKSAGGGEGSPKANQQMAKSKESSPKSNGIETKFPLTVAESSRKENTTEAGLRTERALLTSGNKEEKERDPEKKKGETINKYVSTQSFKTILCSIEEDDSPGVPYYQKPPQTFDKNLFDKEIRKQESPRVTARKLNKGLSLTVEKPSQIKLPSPSDMISNGPDSLRRISDVSVQEEDDNSSGGDKKVEYKETAGDIFTPPMSPQSRLINHECGHDKKSGLISIEMVEDEEEANGKGKEDHAVEQEEFESSHINISVWEFLLSYIRKTNKTKEKFEVLDKGMKNVRDRMDILNIMKKFREFDKLKTLLLEEDQLVLFNAIPKAEIKASTNGAVSTMMSADDLTKSRTFSGRILKKSTFIEINQKQEQIRQSFDNLQLKPKKSKIDYRLLGIYNDLLLHK